MLLLAIEDTLYETCFYCYSMHMFDSGLGGSSQEDCRSLLVIPLFNTVEHTPKRGCDERTNSMRIILACSAKPQHSSSRNGRLTYATFKKYIILDPESLILQFGRSIQTHSFVSLAVLCANTIGVVTKSVFTTHARAVNMPMKPQNG
jgi:hypothetical protein